MSAPAPAIGLDLLQRYDRPGPRYTSYPTAVQFHDGFDEPSYRARLAAAAGSREPLSLYLHLPFCEQRCTFCGCMVVITRKREVAATYLQYLLREIAMLREALGSCRQVVQYHWGGGTPTYLAPAQMAALHEAVLSAFDIDAEAEAGIEVDPRVTSTEQLELLRALGFNRLSLGVQDFAPDVQQAINRVQSVESTRALFDRARSLGFQSINIDLIYGLPRQSPSSFAATVETVTAMRPDRVALYSYAHVPWLRGNQKAIPLADLPGPERKLELFVDAMSRFLGAGYTQIGMDHFALPSDTLAQAAAAGRLHRNFMGYTTRPAPDLIGAGVSAIGEVAGAFAQNVKKLSTYYAALDAGRFPVERGYVLDADDHLRRDVIAGLMCRFRVDRAGIERRHGIDFDTYFREELTELDGAPAADGLVTRDADGITVTAAGRLLVRNLAMIFDRHLRERQQSGPAFSRTI